MSDTGWAELVQCMYQAVARSVTWCCVNNEDAGVAWSVWQNKATLSSAALAESSVAMTQLVPLLRRCVRRTGLDLVKFAEV